MEVNGSNPLDCVSSLTWPLDEGISSSVGAGQGVKPPFIAEENLIEKYSLQIHFIYSFFVCFPFVRVCEGMFSNLNSNNSYVCRGHCTQVMNGYGLGWNSANLCPH